MITVPHDAVPARRWLAHLLRVSVGATRRGDRFDDDLPFDEDAVLQLALRQRIGPLLHRGIADGRIADPLPDTFARACAALHTETELRNGRLLATASEVQRALIRVEIPVAARDGVALIQGPSPVYRDLGSRSQDDVDLVVSRADRARAREEMRVLGFAALPSNGRPDEALGFVRPNKDPYLRVALHANGLAPRARPGPPVGGARLLDELCERWGDGLRRPTRIAKLLFSAIGAASSSLDRWIWYVDLYRLVEGDPLDWDALVRTARRWRIEGPTYMALRATRELLRAPVPRESLEALAPGRVRRQLLQRDAAAAVRQPRRRHPGWTSRLLRGDSWWSVARAAVRDAPLGGGR